MSKKSFEQLRKSQKYNLLNKLRSVNEKEVNIGNNTGESSHQLFLNETQVLSTFVYSHSTIKLYL
jgi:hypothetical protein